MVDGGSRDRDVLEDVTGRLEAAGIAYMVVGSVAMNFYIPVRTTIDIDLVVQLAMADVQHVVDLFSESYYVDDQAVEEAIALRRSFNIIHFSGLIKVDCIIPRATEYNRVQFARRRRLSIGSAPIWVLAPEDLILAKLDWARESRSERQFGDVRAILTSGVPLDRAYLEDWAARLGLDDVLREVSA